MKKRWMRMFAAFAAAAGIMLSCTAPAAAYVEDAAQQETAGDNMSPEEKKRTNEKTAGPLDEETPEKSEPTPFSMPGNAKLVDDAGLCRQKTGMCSILLWTDPAAQKMCT